MITLSWYDHLLSKFQIYQISIYNAIVVTTLLYGCETWTLYERHIRLLNAVHQRCMRSIIRFKWQDYITNDEVCEHTGLPEMDIILRRRILRWAGHVIRMEDGRLPKQIRYGEMISGKRDVGRPKLRYKDIVKASLKGCSINVNRFEMVPSDRALWRKTVF